MLFYAENVENCTDGTLFVQYAGKRIGTKNDSDQKSSWHTIEECAQFCRKNQNQNGTNFFCAGYDFDKKSKTCILHSNSDQNLTQLFEADGFNFYQKQCTKSMDV